MHDLAIDDYLMHANSVVHSIRWIRRRGNLNLSPLAIGRYYRAFKCTFLELLVDPLLVDTAFSLDKR